MTMDAGAVRGYLLQTLGDERSTALEQALLSDGELLAAFEEGERDLVDDYVGRRLSARDAARFERHYLIGAQHEARVVVAEALLRQRRGAVTPWTSRLSHAWPWAAVLVVAVGAWALTAWPREAVHVHPTPAAALTSPAPPAETGTVASRETLHIAIALPATTMRSRSDATPRARLTPGVAFVDLLIENAPLGLVDAAVEVRSVDERLVWSAHTTAASSATDAVRVRVPADRLTSDDYIVTLFAPGGAAATHRFFRVVRD